MSLQEYILSPGNSRWAILVRAMLAGVFVSEGSLKLTDPAWLGSGRFAKIGIPWPDVFGPCGLLMAFGLFGRLR